MISDQIIRNFEKEILTDKEFFAEIESYINRGYSIIVGSDSQKYFEHTVMVTAFVVYHQQKGNNCFYVKQEIPNEMYPSLRTRIFDEAFKSIEGAFIIKEKFNCPITIHLDIGDDPEKNRTHQFVSELVGMVSGQGFDVEIKPKSFASSGFADWFTK